MRAYRRMLELKHGAVGLPLLLATAAASILGQQQERGPSHNMYEQTQRNAVYLAVDDRPVETRMYPADAIVVAYLLFVLPFPFQRAFHCTELWLVACDLHMFSLFVNTLYGAQEKERH